MKPENQYKMKNLTKWQKAWEKKFRAEKYNGWTEKFNEALQQQSSAKQEKNQQTQRHMIWNCPIKQKEKNNEKPTLKKKTVRKATKV